MARSKTDTVEYFPHVAKQGKTLYILEGQFGNDGYAFWFKLLEILALSDGHFYDASTDVEWNYLVARSKVSSVSATEMIELLCRLGNLDANLWQNNKYIWCQALVDNLSEVYRKRKRPLPDKPKPSICDRNANNCDRNMSKHTHPATESTQSRVEESKGKERKDIAPPENGDASPFFSCQFFEVPKAYRKKLATEYPAMTDAHLLREFSKMEDWVSDNRKKKKFKANGNIANPKLFIKNWLERIIVPAQAQPQPTDMDTYLDFLAERDGVKLCGKA